MLLRAHGLSSRPWHRSGGHRGSRWRGSGRGKVGEVEWLNEPPSWEARGEALLVTAGPQTDFWRTTHYGFVRDSGHLCFQSWDGDFVAEVKVTGAYRDQYDQAGLMVRRDERVWLKCGVEFVDGRQHASAVVTREESDWSIAPLTGNPRSLWLRVSRTGPDVEVRYSVDGAHYDLLRLSRLTDAGPLLVGPMCAAPDGAGFAVTFEGFTLGLPDE
jgi:regulation of enolase protein 1 (concanavalin A-like superfamily)